MILNVEDALKPFSRTPACRNYTESRDLMSPAPRDLIGSCSMTLIMTRFIYSSPCKCLVLLHNYWNNKGEKNHFYRKSSLRCF